MEDWITVPNWERFQHYKYRRPTWIKNYTSLLHKPEYLGLTLTERGLLHTLWLAYADNDGQLRASDLCGVVAAKQRRQVHLEALNHAGFVVLSASKNASVTLKEQRVPDATPQNAETVEYVTIEQIRAYAATL